MDGSLPPLALADQIAQRTGLSVVRVAEGRSGAHVPEGCRATHRDVVPAALRSGPASLLAAGRSVWFVPVSSVWDEALEGPLRALLASAPCTVLVDRSRESGRGPALLARLGVEPVFEGGWSHGPGAGGWAAVFEPTDGFSCDPGPPPSGFTVTAFMTVYNEDDVLDTVLDDLEDQGVQAYVLDNWSTDDTYEIARRRLGGAVAGLERWPADGPPEHFDLRASLDRVTDLASSLGSDWYIKHDADEIRRSPWPGVSLRDGLWRAQCSSASVVDFTVLNYQPTNDGFDRGHDLWHYFTHFEFGDKPGHFKQFKAWRNFGQDVDYSTFGSHRIAFTGARVFPYKFELHHYPIRSQRHGLRKVLAERLGRYLPAAKERGWHRHYDDVSSATDFLRDRSELLARSTETWSAHRVELLSGAGLPRVALP